LQSSGKDIAIPLVHLLNRTDPVALTIRIISTAVILFRHNLIIALRRSCHGPSLSVPSFFNISSFELNDSRRECATMAMIPAGAMVRDAGRRIDRNPFNDLPANWWPRLPQREPDPYTDKNETHFWLTIALTVRLGLMHSFISDSGRERDRVKQPRSSGEVSIYSTLGQRLHYHGI
jgi:hypothetical protein